MLSFVQTVFKRYFYPRRNEIVTLVFGVRGYNGIFSLFICDMTFHTKLGFSMQYILCKLPLKKPFVSIFFYYNLANNLSTYFSPGGK